MMNKHQRAQYLMERFRRFKETHSWGHLRIHPTLRLEDRDLIIEALEQLIQREASQCGFQLPTYKAGRGPAGNPGLSTGSPDTE